MPQKKDILDVANQFLVIGNFSARHLIFKIVAFAH